MTRRTSSWTLALIIALGACSIVTGADAVATDRGLSVHASRGRLTLHNASSIPIHYVALEEETSTRVDLYFDPSEWPSIPPRSQVRIRYEDLMGYEPGSERAVIYWWTEGSESSLLRVDLR